MLRRQKAPECRFGTKVTLLNEGEAGLAIYQTHNGHLEFFVRQEGKRCQAVLRIRLHSILHEQSVVTIPSPSARLDVQAFGDHYEFLLDGQPFAAMDSKLLSTEMAGGFTGVTIGPYCRTGKATFQGFDYQE